MAAMIFRTLWRAGLDSVAGGPGTGSAGGRSARPGAGEEPGVDDGRGSCLLLTVADRGRSRQAQHPDQGCFHPTGRTGPGRGCFPPHQAHGAGQGWLPSSPRMNPYLTLTWIPGRRRPSLSSGTRSPSEAHKGPAFNRRDLRLLLAQGILRPGPRVPPAPFRHPAASGLRGPARRTLRPRPPVGTVE